MIIITKNKKYISYTFLIFVKIYSIKTKLYLEKSLCCHSILYILNMKIKEKKIWKF